MPPMMTTRSAGWPAAASRGGGTGGRAGRSGGRTRGHYGDQGNGRIDGQGGQVGGQGSEVNDGINEVPDFSTIIAQQDSQKVKYIAGSFVGKALTWWNSQIHTRGREAVVGLAMLRILIGFMSWLVPHLVTLEGKRIERYMYDLALQIRGMVAAMEPKTIQKAVQIAGSLTDEVLRNGSIKKNLNKRGNGGEPSKDRNGREDNKITRTGNAFPTTINPVERENTGTVSKCTTCNTHHPPEAPCRTCFNCNRPDHFTKDCRVVPRNVNPMNARNPTIRACYECGSTNHIRSACPKLNRAQGPGGNRLNQALTNNGGQGRGNQENQTRGRAFMLEAEQARQNPNIMTILYRVGGDDFVEN
ncbi:putative reverse transcriptase domain-containing protein [Tanacetum coccineum]